MRTWKLCVQVILLIMLLTCSAPDNPADGFEELTGIQLADNVTIIDYQFDERLGWSYLGTIVIKDSVWLTDFKKQFENKVGWECQSIVYMEENKKFYKKYFDFEFIGNNFSPVVLECKKDLGNGRKGRVKICKNRLYFHYFEILDP